MKGFFEWQGCGFGKDGKEEAAQNLACATSEAV
jgi:hypothetical protein